MMRPQSCRRAGSLSSAMLFALPVLLMLVFVAVNHVHLVFGRAATLRVTDASALAAAQALVVDAHLTADENDLLVFQADAAIKAQAVADLNPVSPGPLVYDVSQPDPNDNDIRFTTIANPLDPGGTLLLIDSVEVIGRRTGANAVPIFGGSLFSLQAANLVTRSRALLDRRVIGLRPVFLRNVPLAPIALLDTDWASKVAVTVGPPHTISSYTVTLGDPLTPVSSFLFIGTTTLTEASAQFANGVNPGELASFGGEFVLGPGGTLDVAGEETTTDAAGLDAIRNELLALQASGTALAWPLHSAHAGGTTTVSDFVAARVASVGAVTPAGANATLTVTLTPAFLAAPTIATDASRPVNPYLCRVRLAN